MTVTKWFTGSALFLLVATAHAHAHLTAAVPAEGSAGKAPEHVVLTFSEAARITAMTLQREGEEARKLSPLPTEMAARITVPLPKLLPGKYTLSWRVVGDDGHVVPGALHFTVLESPAGGGGGA
ncbi:MAG TPA: copper resistance CopC family protein [Steroidobacteraceae bacterium]|jgi:methionine-rich copper-binding protein CopC|nr:copper resistance CopC family protein [Steroidobacteraceae bacterium]